MERVNAILMGRLKDKGLFSVEIALFIKDAARAVEDDSRMGLQEMNRRLHVLGWDSIDLDDHTLQLMIAHFEAEDFSAADKNRPA